MEHPSAKRLAIRARSEGSTATTLRGRLNYLRARGLPLLNHGKRLTSAQWREHNEARKLNHKYSNRRTQARAVAALFGTINTELNRAQQRCTTRRLSSRSVAGVIVSAPNDSGREYVAASYGYSYTWTQARSKLRGLLVHWGVQRVGASYQVCLDQSIHAAALRDVYLSQDILLDNDAFALRRGRIYYRYDLAGRPTGVAKRLSAPWLRSNSYYYEHGTNLAQIRAERAKKLELLAATISSDWADAIAEEQSRAAAALRRFEEARAESIRLLLRLPTREEARQRDERRLRLLARLSERIQVSREDARASGACLSGIDSWCEKYGIPNDLPTLSARRVVQLAIESGQRVAMAAAVRAARHALGAQ